MQIIQTYWIKFIKVSVKWKDICRNYSMFIDMFINILYQFSTSFIGKLKTIYYRFPLIARVLECMLGPIDESLGVLNLLFSAALLGIK